MITDYEEAIRALENYIKREPDGTFRLDVDAKSTGIDPIVLANVKQSIAETNRHVLAGEYHVGDEWNWNLP